MEHQVMMADVDPESKIYPLMFDDNLVEVPAGQNFTVCIKVATSTQRMRSYYGYSGNNYKTLDNKDKDIFTISYSSMSTNGTGVDSG